MGDQELKLFRVPDDMESDVKIIRLCDLPHISIPNIGLQFEVTPEVIKVLNELQEYRG
jgi:hypothetical protein